MTPHQTKCLEAALTDILGTPFRFGKMARVIAGKDDREEPPMWNNPMQYFHLFSYFISHVLVEKGMSTVSAKNLFQRENFGDSMNGIIDYLIEHQIAQGYSLAEIGGTVAKSVFTPLGADVTDADAGRVDIAGDVDRVTFSGHSEYARDTLLLKPDSLITLDNFSDTFPEKYDITLSQMLFDGGSGIEAIANCKNKNEAIWYASEELMMVFANITKHGGFSLHGNTRYDFKKFFLQYIGFKQIYQGKYVSNDLVVFEKTEPQPSLFPGGYWLGNGIIDFDASLEQFYMGE